jgi:hypothetical protein
MTTDARRRHLCLLAAADLERMDRDSHLPGQGRRSATTTTIDVAFWLVYGAGLAALAYLALR